MVDLLERIDALETKLQEGSDEAVSDFKERVVEIFAEEEFHDAVHSIVEDHISNSDDVCTLSDVYDFLRDNVRVELDVSRY
jgi:hypothetical protein